MKRSNLVPRHQSSRRRAAVAVMVVVTIPVLLGFAALTIDVGLLHNTRADLQHTADAAAMAAAHAYAGEAAMKMRMGESTSDSYSEVSQSAWSNAEQISAKMMTFNARRIAIDRADLSLGYLNASSATDPMDSGAHPSTFNAVQVVTRRDLKGQNGPLELIFATIFGRHTAEVTASAVAVFDDRFSEFDAPRDPMRIWPFTKELSDYNAQLTTGGDDYGYDSDAEAVSGGADGTREIILYPGDEAPGNYGLLNIGPTSLSADEIKTQILDGITPDDLESTFGTSDLTFFDGDGSPTPYDVPGNPGLKAKIEDAIQVKVGDIVGFFVHDAVVKSGANTVYHVVGMRFGRVMHVALQAAAHDRGLWIQPVAYDGPGVRTNMNAPRSSGAAGHVVLAR